MKPASTPASNQVVLDVDLVVIGGGSAGIHAAIQLKDAGAKVAVIEKKKQIGGRTSNHCLICCKTLTCLNEQMLKLSTHPTARLSMSG